MIEKPNTTMPGTVWKISKPVGPEKPEKAEIAVDGADELYREIRMENTLNDAKGNEVKQKTWRSSRSHGRSSCQKTPR